MKTVKQMAKEQAVALNTPLCELCGCVGNCGCGHEPLGEDCSLDRAGVCGCCNRGGGL